MLRVAQDSFYRKLTAANALDTASFIFDMPSVRKLRASTPSACTCVLGLLSAGVRPKAFAYAEIYSTLHAFLERPLCIYTYL